MPGGIVGKEPLKILILYTKKDINDPVPSLFPLLIFFCFVSSSLPFCND